MPIYLSSLRMNGICKWMREREEICHSIFCSLREGKEEEEESSLKFYYSSDEIRNILSCE
jgi:hypothetical protein